MISAITIDYLLNKIENETTRVAFVYCNYKAQHEQNSASLMGALLKQLVQRRPSMAKSAERLWRTHEEKGSKPSVDEISNALHAVLQEFSTAYIVINALDELQDNEGTRYQLLNRLQSLQAKHDLRLMATSRYIPDTVETFKDAIKFEVRAQDDDMSSFITGQIPRLPKCIQRDSALQTSVREKIIEAADGM